MSSLVCYKSRYSIRTHSLCYKFYYKTRACLIASHDTYGFTHSRAKRRQLWMRFFVIAPAEGKPTRGLFFLAKLFAPFIFFLFFSNVEKKEMKLCKKFSWKEQAYCIAGPQDLARNRGGGSFECTDRVALRRVWASWGPYYVRREWIFLLNTSCILENNLSLLL